MTAERVKTADTPALAAKIVSAYVSHNKIKSGELPALLQCVHDSLRALASDSPAARTGKEPAVPINKSVANDYVICLEDGKKLRMLKRYLRTHHNLSPEEYRAKLGLPADYPMTAPAYSKQRSKLAKDIGLGRGAKKRPATRGTRQKRAHESAAKATPASARMISQTHNGRRVLPSLA